MRVNSWNCNIFLLGLAMAVPAAGQTGAAPAGDEAARAAVLFQQGREAFVPGNFAVACPKLAESFRLDPATGTLMALAACHAGEGKLGLAWAELTEAEERARLEGRTDRLQYIHGQMEKLRPRVFGGAAPVGVEPGAAVPVAISAAVQDPMDVRAAPEPLGAPAATSSVVDLGMRAATAALPTVAYEGRLRVGGLVFFGGEADTDGFGPSDLETTFGVFAGYEHPLHPNFLLGGEVLLSWWKGRGDLGSVAGTDFGYSPNESNTLVAVLAKPKARYPVVLGGARLLELHAGVPLGLNVNSWANDSIKTGLGFSVGLAAGGSYWLGESTALLGEFGFMYHSPSNKSVDFGTGSSSFDTSFLQWGLNLGLQFAL